MQAGPLLRGIGLMAIALLGAELVTNLLGQTLYRPSFLTGWIAAGFVLLVAIQCCFVPKELSSFAKRMRSHLLMSAVFLFFFSVHTGGRLPSGWLETLIFALASLTLMSAIAGAVLFGSSQHSEVAERSAERWVRLQVPLTFSLFALGVFHGAFVHLQGLLAYVFLYSEG